jgi:hypothetical protein
MSMICSILGLTPAQIDRLAATPVLVSHLVDVANDEIAKVHRDEMLRELTPEQRQRFDADQAAYDRSPDAKEWQARIAEARKRIARLGGIERQLGLEKSWHILHYLLTGDVEPVGGDGDLLLTGEELGEDRAYGPPRLHSPMETQEFSRFLATQDLADLQARVDIREMSRLGVYPVSAGAGNAECENTLRSDIGRYFVRLLDYVDKMSDRGNGLLVWID